MQSKLPLLPSGPGGVRKSAFHGPWQNRSHNLDRSVWWEQVLIVFVANPPQSSGSAGGLTEFDSPGMVRVALLNGTPIPLTLSLSHAEREQSAAGSIVREVRWVDTALGFAERQRRILPLPRGSPGKV